MFKKIKNYHLYILILIVFILNTILFKSIDITFAQFPSPPGAPGEQLTNIVVNPLQEDLNLGGQSIIGDGDITADGTVCDENGCIGDNSFSGDLTVGGYKIRECNSATINSAGWYRIAVNGPMINGGNGGNRATGKFTVWDTDSSEHSAITFYASVHFGKYPSLNLLNRSRYGGGHIDKIRLIEADTYAGAAVEIYVGSSSNLPGNTLYYCLEENFQASSWSPVDWTAGDLPSGFSATQLDLDTYDPIFAVTGDGHDNAFFVTGSGSLSASGNITAPGFFYSSDKTLKKNIKKITNPLERIIQLEGVSFNWKKDNQESIGLIAQDVEKVFPELVFTNKEGLKTVAYGNLIAPLIEALKIQDNKIEQLIKEIEQLKND